MTWPRRLAALAQQRQRAAEQDGEDQHLQHVALGEGVDHVVGISCIKKSTSPPLSLAARRRRSPSPRRRASSGRCSCRRRAARVGEHHAEQQRERRQRPRSRATALTPTRPTCFRSPAPAMPCTTTQKTIGAMIILISLMKPSPSGLRLSAKSGYSAEHDAQDERHDDLAEQRADEAWHLWLPRSGARGGRCQFLPPRPGVPGRGGPSLIGYVPDGGADLPPPISKLAIISSARTMAEWSQAAAAVRGAGVEQLLRGRRVGQRDAELRARRLQREVQVLLVQLDAEARVEGALDHALAVHLEDARAGEAAHQRLAHLGRIGAGLGGEQQRLGHRLDGQRDDDLVGDLGRSGRRRCRRPA